MNVLFLAKKFSDINYAKFLWSNSFVGKEFYEGETTDANLHNTSFRGSKGNIIIGASCKNKEAIFSAGFISKFFIPNLNEGKIYDKLSRFLVGNLGDLKKDFESNLYNFFTVEIAELDLLLRIDSQEYRQGMSEAFRSIEFAPRIRCYQ